VCSIFLSGRQPYSMVWRGSRLHVRRTTDTSIWHHARQESRHGSRKETEVCDAPSAGCAYRNEKNIFCQLSRDMQDVSSSYSLLLTYKMISTKTAIFSSIFSSVIHLCVKCELQLWVNPPISVCKLTHFIVIELIWFVVWDSVFDIVTHYGLDSVESWWGWDFLHLFQLALGHMQPPVWWGVGGGGGGRGGGGGGGGGRWRRREACVHV